MHGELRGHLSKHQLSAVFTTAPMAPKAPSSPKAPLMLPEESWVGSAWSRLPGPLPAFHRLLAGHPGHSGHLFISHSPCHRSACSGRHSKPELNSSVALLVCVHSVCFNRPYLAQSPLLGVLSGEGGGNPSGEVCRFEGSCKQRLGDNGNFWEAGGKPQSFPPATLKRVWTSRLNNYFS